MAELGSAGSPVIYPNGEDWCYQNGCVHLILSQADAITKCKEFEKHPKRHMDYYEKHKKVLGLDVPYDAWQKDEVTYEAGQWFKNVTGELYMLARNGNFVYLVSKETGTKWSDDVPVSDFERITQAEFKEIVGTKKFGHFTPVKVKIEIVED